jgi:hypothetical protein
MATVISIISKKFFAHILRPPAPSLAQHILIVHGMEFSFAENYHQFYTVNERCSHTNRTAFAFSLPTPPFNNIVIIAITVIFCIVLVCGNGSPKQTRPTQKRHKNPSTLLSHYSINDFFFQCVALYGNDIPATVSPYRSFPGNPRAVKIV